MTRYDYWAVAVLLTLEQVLSLMTPRLQAGSPGTILVGLPSALREGLITYHKCMLSPEDVSTTVTRLKSLAPRLFSALLPFQREGLEFGAEALMNIVLVLRWL